MPVFIRVAAPTLSWAPRDAIRCPLPILRRYSYGAHSAGSFDIRLPFD